MKIYVFNFVTLRIKIDLIGLYDMCRVTVQSENSIGAPKIRNIFLLLSNFQLFDIGIAIWSFIELLLCVIAIAIILNLIASFLVSGFTLVHGFFQVLLSSLLL